MELWAYHGLDIFEDNYLSDFLFLSPVKLRWTVA
jgi:hypothetical protein